MNDGIVVAEPVLVGEPPCDVVSTGGSLIDFLADSAGADSSAKATIPIVDTPLPSGSLVVPSRDVVVEPTGAIGESRYWLCEVGVRCLI